MEEEPRSIDDVKSEIAALKNQLNTDINVENEVTYTDGQLERVLKRLPVVMYDACTVVVLRLIDFKEAKRQLNKIRGMTMMKANNLKTEKHLTAQKDREAWASQQPEVEAAEIALINAEAEYKIAEYRLEQLDNLYTGVKKMIAMRLQQNQAQDRYNNA